MSTESQKRSRTCWLAAAALLLAAALACAPPDQDSESGELPPSLVEAADTIACPSHTTLSDTDAMPIVSDSLLRARYLTMLGRQGQQEADQIDAELANLGIVPGLVGVRVNAQNDTTLVWRSPMYHDCQDLIVGTPGTDDRVYTTRAGITTTIQNAVLDDGNFTADPNTGHRLAVADRLVGADYDNLRLDDAEVCIYVGAGSANVTDPWWAAALECAGDTVDRATVPVERILRVHRLTYEAFNFGFADYPAVSRWEWDEGRQRQAYGFKCGTAWCLAAVAEPEVFQDVFGAGTSPQEVILGWRDEQYLAEVTHPNDPALGTPSDEYVVVRPHPGLGSLTEADLDSPVAEEVGFLHEVEASPMGPYFSKFGLRGRGRGHRVRFTGPTATLAAQMTRHIPPPSAADPAPTINRDVMYHPLGGGVKVVPTARWGWSLTDEEQWYGCADGCCETMECIGGC